MLGCPFVDLFQKLLSGLRKKENLILDLIKFKSTMIHFGQLLFPTMLYMCTSGSFGLDYG